MCVVVDADTPYTHGPTKGKILGATAGTGEAIERVN